MIKYSELIQKARNNNNNQDIKNLLALRELFICAVSMKYNKDYGNIIFLLTGVQIEDDAISKLSDKLLRDYKKKEKELHSPNEHMSFLGDMNDT